MKRVRKVLPISLDVVVQSNAHNEIVDEYYKRRDKFEKQENEILKELDATDTKLRKECRKLLKDKKIIESPISKRVIYIAKLYGKEFGGTVKKVYWNEITSTSRIIKTTIWFAAADNAERMRVAPLMFKGGKDKTRYGTTLPIPTKWLYNDFEEEFYSKAKMIKTFQ